jgi:hypothetical protein
MARPLDLEQAMGQHLRAIREGAGVPREMLAEAVQRRGIPWTVATITLIERGRRRITTGELLLLPYVLNKIIPREHWPYEGENPVAERRRLFRASDLVPVLSAEKVAVTPDCEAYPNAIPDVMNGVSMEKFDQLFSNGLFTTRRAQERPFWDEVTLRIARSMRLPFRTVAAAASVVWGGRTFLIERDERLKTRLPAGASPRKIQALRGHVSREMKQELQTYLKTPKGGDRGPRITKTPTKRR